MSYKDKLTAEALAALMQPGTITMATVHHEDACAFHDDQECNCEPTLSLRRVIGPDDPLPGDVIQ